MFEKLEVYQKALNVTEQIQRLSRDFSRGNYYLADQINRAALSIPANIAEGNGRWHTNERRQFFWIARGSVYECVPLVEMCLRQGLVEPSAAASLKVQLEEIAKMICGLISGLENKKNKIAGTLVKG
jgi:four helix bundle protein